VPFIAWVRPGAVPSERSKSRDRERSPGSAALAQQGLQRCDQMGGVAAKALVCTIAVSQRRRSHAPRSSCHP